MKILLDIVIRKGKQTGIKKNPCRDTIHDRGLKSVAQHDLANQPTPPAFSTREEKEYFSKNVSYAEVKLKMSSRHETKHYTKIQNSYHWWDTAKSYLFFSLSVNFS